VTTSTKRTGAIQTDTFSPAPRSDIDRVSPTRAPTEAPIGFQRWQRLLFLHWFVSADALRAVVPEALELDLLGDTALVGIVPFVMRDIRPTWFPQGLGFNFLELNLRTYVRLNGEPGVYFFSLDATSRIASTIGRYQWGLPYFPARAAITSDQQGVTTFRSDRRGSKAPTFECKYRPSHPLGPAPPGTIEHFLLERYVMFIARGGHILRGRVHHAPYPAQRVEIMGCHESYIAAAELPATSGAPDLAHYADSVDVHIYRPTRVA